MPPIKKAAPRKAAPRKAPTVPPQPVSGDDNFHAWEDAQPIIDVVLDETDDFPSGDESEPVERERVKEIAPKIPSPTKVRAQSFMDRLRGKPAPAKRGRSKAAVPRVSVEGVITTGWGLLAGLAKNVNPPVAKVLTLQAPVAGMLLEDKVRNTAIDKILQPFARTGDNAELAIALLGPPLIVGALTTERGLAMQDTLVPLLRQSLKSWVKLAGPQLKKLAEEEQKFEEEYGMQIDAMIAFIMSGPEQPSAADSPNGSHAPHAVPTPSA